MVFVTSGPGGFTFAEFRKLLAKAHFTNRDTLYILGDVVGWGNEGIKALRWFSEHEYTKLIMGYNEYKLLNCLGYLESLDISNENERQYDDLIEDVIKDTLKVFCRMKEENPDEYKRLTDYLRNLPLYEETESDGKKFVLVHGGLGNFSPERKLSNYTAKELFLGSPDLETDYNDDSMVIFGHTPTAQYGEKYEDRIFRTKTWTNVATLSPSVLRLDDMEEFYTFDEIND